MNTIKRGALAGIAGGMVMAIWAMLALWADGSGLFAPLNLLAHTFWRGAPLDGTFNLGAVVLGVAIHLTTSMILGVVFAVALAQVGAPRQNLARQLITGAVFGLIVWVVSQFGIWPLIDGQAAPRFTPWAFAIGHTLFGLIIAWTLYVTSTKTGHQAMHQRPPRRRGEPAGSP